MAKLTTNQIVEVTTTLLSNRYTVTRSDTVAINFSANNNELVHLAGSGTYIIIHPRCKKSIAIITAILGEPYADTVRGKEHYLRWGQEARK